CGSDRERLIDSNCSRSNSDTTTSIPLRPMIASGTPRLDHRTMHIYAKLFMGQNTRVQCR
ncbi:hypothetical protein, partial [Ralstonia solanacearum]|uniref:hypothetical protein n=1 Tax=Ralstonia solanacearum TaxID=305 RepID=UPI0035EB2FFB